MTFNVRYDGPRDEENSWRIRRDPVVQTIAFFKTDIAGLQETLVNQIEDLEERLPGYNWIGVGRDDGKHEGEFCPLFYLKDRFRLLDHSTFWLSETPKTPGIRGWDAACARIVTWAHFEDGWSGANFYVFNTHFDHLGRKARAASAALLLARIQKIAGPSQVIVTGDFNCTEEDPPYRILTTADNRTPALHDSRHLSQLPPYGSSFSFNGFSNEIRSRHPIDHIFLRFDTDVFRWGILSTIWDGRFSSDHFPVLAEIQLAQR
jgi:endonuclease/exonuclease/phosphatase family metal-dependent hydrolase